MTALRALGRKGSWSVSPIGLCAGSACQTHADPAGRPYE
jgi:hypothetical protein